jgi:hypothetical protein
MMTEDTVLRLDAKLASVNRSGNNAVVCFYVRGQLSAVDALAALEALDKGTDLMLGVVVSREVATPNGTD